MTTNLFYDFALLFQRKAAGFHLNYTKNGNKRQGQTELCLPLQNQPREILEMLTRGLP
jgi:hypothetical protein